MSDLKLQSNFRSSLDGLWSALTEKHERERRVVATVLNALSGFATTADEALANLDRDLQSLAARPEPPGYAPPAMGSTGYVPPPIHPDQMANIAHDLQQQMDQRGTTDAEAALYLNRLR